MQPAKNKVVTFSRYDILKIEQITTLFQCYVDAIDQREEKPQRGTIITLQAALTTVKLIVEGINSSAGSVRKTVPSGNRATHFATPFCRVLKIINI